MSIFRRASNELTYLRGALRTLGRVTPIGKTPSRTIRDLAEEWAEQHGDKPALVSDGAVLSYRGLNALANRYAGWARAQGIRKGDVVALLMFNRPDYLAVWLGFAKIGAATALLNTNQTGAALAHSVKVVGARLAVVEAALRPTLQDALDRHDTTVALHVYGSDDAGLPRIDEAVAAFSDANPADLERPPLSIDDRCVFVYTSGTTGLPKAANINHYRVLLAMQAFAGVSGAKAGDRLYSCLPMYHTNGGVLAPGAMLSVGGTCVLRDRFSAREFWSDIQRHDCTMFIYIGELCRYLLNSPPHPDERRHRIRLAFGNGLRPDVWEPFRARFRIPRIVEFYGATEGNSTIFNFDGTPGAVGRVPGWAEKKFPMRLIRFDVEAEMPVRDAEGRCIACGPDEPGELVGLIVNDPKRPANRFEGYADRRATETKILRDVFEPGDMYFRTGDLLRRDKLGYFFFIDRVGDTFRRKGENVATSEVSEHLTTFPGVREANVYGVPVPGLEGKVGMASLIVDDPAGFDFAAFQRHCVQALADYARPVFVRLPRALDITGTFKQRKVGLVAEGFDPARTDDPLFVVNPATGTFDPIDAATHARIVSGAIRL
ncbi:long-chain-acyl-CoA synthetase [Lichenihabitans sp. Uapishka_5]|uniref:long-chain-acyl-CoA synthetase n=1 Tax=Lichenihabitans sp. Uapishka_5 TaxID=3037302 RepID=UPI0029E7DAE9|nr:long-chain-acyl-CoA synthetase [Lichenihabitans sp. Uapishka_5]MDX7952043.1 long-chain-acyl-CoA synthetase [Lichenihabitans sp. Uapishka_5]